MLALSDPRCCSADKQLPPSADPVVTGIAAEELQEQPSCAAHTVLRAGFPTLAQNQHTNTWKSLNIGNYIFHCSGVLEKGDGGSSAKENLPRFAIRRSKFFHIIPCPDDAMLRSHQHRSPHGPGRRRHDPLTSRNQHVVFSQISFYWNL